MERKNFRALLDKVTYEKNITEQAYGIAMSKIGRMNDEKSASNIELAEFLLGKACVYQDTDLYNEAVKLIGIKEVIIKKTRLGLPLWEEDLEYITKNLK